MIQLLSGVAPVTLDPAPARPDYDDHLKAFHQAFFHELSYILAALQIGPNDAVLDAPCGDGFYALRIAGHLDGSGKVTAIDQSPAYLAELRRRALCQGLSHKVDCLAADTYRLPFADGSFDLVWCAQSLISLEHPVLALREFRRVLRPGGRVAVLENDNYHQALLPWPVDLELAIFQALRRESESLYHTPSRICPGRYLRPMFEAAGFRSYSKQTHAADRQAPLSAADAAHLRHYFETLYDLVAARLSVEARARLEALIDPDAPGSFFRRPDFEMTYINVVSVGTK